MSVKTINSFRYDEYVYYTRLLTFILLRMRFQMSNRSNNKGKIYRRYTISVSCKRLENESLSCRETVRATPGIKNMRMSFSHSVSLRIPQCSKIRENFILIVALSLHLSLHILESVNFTVKKYILTEIL